MAFLSIKTKIIHARIPKEDYDKLQERYGDKSLAKVIRALIQMHLNNKIGRLEFTQTEKL